MAEELGQSKSEAPTPRRREEARRQGQVAVSVELTTGLMLLAGVGGLWLGGQALGSGLLEALRLEILGLHAADLGPEQAQALFALLLGRAGELLLFFLGLMLVAGLGAGVLQVGFYITPEALLPRWGKLSPAQGWMRLLSLAATVRGVAAVLKVAVIAALLYWVLRGRTAQIATLGEGPLSQSLGVTWDMILRLALAVAAALVLIGLADYGYQRWQHEQTLFMTRQELKDEIKREEGDPLLRARIRKLQREATRKRMMGDVPRASVVITNPTHLAIALRYDRGLMPAPRVLAKGAGHVAARIVELARRHAVPVVERKPLAQALYKAVEVGRDIPLALYQAVAEVLAYVYRLRGGMPGKREAGA